MDWIRLVQCLTAVKAVMITHGPYVAGNSERQAAPEKGVRTMEIHFLVQRYWFIAGTQKSWASKFCKVEPNICGL